MSDRLTADAIYRLADRHQRLQTRRFELLPLRGEGAAFTDVQGRGWGSDAATSPTELEDLISSIAAVGQLQPVLVEETDGGDRKLVSGERRLRAMRWGSMHHPDNAHFASIAAVIVDGPLSEEERRSWQLIENLARVDLQPGELAAALVYERCAVLTSRLLASGVAVPRAVATLDDPLARFDALDKMRRNAELHSVGAPWREVIQRIGIQLSQDKAKKLVQAFRAMPPELSSEMDAAEVSLHSRMEFLKLHRGRSEAATEIWAALQERDEAQLLTRAVTEAVDHPTASAGELVDAAEAFHEASNAARAASLRSGGGEPATPSQADRGLATEISSETAAACRTAIGSLLDQLRAGAALSRYDQGSLRLLIAELASYLNPGAETEAA
ncbi:MAG: ParB/RepB/Spo0J family partition protein [Gemmatimonadota bacterium]|nr:ParB/RepB/Spo0J family partition protein [Gemmatimonadota bacterium]MDH3570187.1 ParB/RepB/Spo0J family partition protein [Gemmatimonadota bacterium]MDH5614912.1 ParB/RepB/Spo0J family partition protein [Acidimicrobiia bacterium]